MGLSCGAVELIIHEHFYRPLSGDVLLIGRQNTDITPQAMTNLLQLYGLTPRVPLAIEKPGTLAHNTIMLSEDTARVADVAVFHALADCKVSALDISDYEGAEIVHDLNLPLPDKYKGRFDFIFDGSCLDNIFNGPQALISFSELLRPGGRLLIYDASNSARTAYLQYSPDWFFDYFAANGYADCKVYVHEFPTADAEPVIPNPVPPGGLPPQAGCLWHFDPTVVYGGKVGVKNSHITDLGERYVYAIAEKAANSTSTIPPVQLQNRGADAGLYIEAAQRFRASARPLFQPRTGEPFMAPSISSYEVLYPISRWSRRTYPKQKPSPQRNESPVKIPARPGALSRAS